ncbi:hypothetical protein [Paenibacillus sp. MBLB4367]|uniref:hypothetical protein n=1 Tax=Paenibacillus sp. MBLB4367 TaxID=3384767 RepID=UPI0039083D5D
MEGYTGIPQNIEEYMDFSMLTQAAGLQLAVEHYRRNKPRTSGALIWQLNDCWPGTSWSMIEYCLLPKASYYYSAKFFHPILLTVDHEIGDKMTVYVVNDTLAALNDVVSITISDFSGRILYEAKYPVQVKANSVLPIAELPENVLQGHSAYEAVLHVQSEMAYWDNTERVMQVAKKVGARFIRVALPVYDGSRNYHDLFAEEVDYLHHVQELSQQYGVKGLVEIHHRTIAPSAGLIGIRFQSGSHWRPARCRKYGA